MEPGVSLQCSQEPSIGPYPEPDQSIPSHPIWTLYNNKKNGQTTETQICRQCFWCLPHLKTGFCPLEKNVLGAFMRLPLMYHSPGLTVHGDV
jgi:hypothetical protein